MQVFWGCHLLVESGSAKHHPQKRHLPRQAGQAQAFIWGLKWKRIEHYMRYHKIQKIVQQIFVGLFGDLCK
jgi:hypothetical protein